MRTLVAAWTLLLAAVSIVLAWTSMSLEFRSAPYRSVAARLESGDPVPIADLQSRATSVAEQGGAISCRPDLVHTDLVLHMATIDRYSFLRDAAALKAALVAGRNTLIRTLDCTPADGNLWLRLAMVDGALTKNVQTVDKVMALSNVFAPGEVPILRMRMAFWSSWPLIPPGPATVALNRDIATVASWLRPQDAVPMLAAVPPSAGAQVRAAVAALPDERRADLRRAGLPE